MGVVIQLPEKGHVVAFPSLRAAAGSHGDSQLDVEQASVRLPGGRSGQFAVRASGDSMDGGLAPIRDGDWVIMDWARGAAIDAFEGRVALVGRGDPHAGPTHHLKRVASTDGGIVLGSDNPNSPDLETGSDTALLARLAAVVRPEELAPRVGAVVGDVAAAFGVSEHPAVGISRVDGHLFLLVAEEGRLVEPDRVAWAVPEQTPSETAYVLTMQGEAWRYAGVGRASGDQWSIPAVDHPTWRVWGQGRGVSRRLDGRWAQGAAAMVVFLEGALASGDSIEERSRSCRFRGATSTGGVRVDHERMKTPRTVTANDLAWVLAARNDVERNGGVLDEARVNFVRYLEGTPKSSTRWIDTGWALVLLARAERLGFVATMAYQPGENVRFEEQGQVVDATFHVDRNLAGSSVVLEARGGTAGTGEARNTEYGRGLRLVLERLAVIGATLVDVYVDSSAVSSLALGARRIRATAAGGPVALGSADVGAIQREITRQMAQVGRAPGARGSGNGTKRLRLVVEAEEELVQVLRRGRDSG